ncbi:MAG: outer membrane beta-barrel protein [Flavobacteriaceae bacterium]|nr:outer membrane beta-barrel protein [Flavobacteriaceae bacterium]
MKIFKTTVLALALLAGSLTHAQDESVTEEVAVEATEEKPSFSVSGSIDTYYRSNDYAPYTSFANLPGFALGMANIVLSYEGEKSGFVADLVYGPRGADAVFNSAGSSNIVNQLYAYYNVNDKLTLTLGNFNTFLGYEVISPVANFNYSTSYMFSYGPFSHTGFKADYAVSDNVSIMVAVMNATDETEADYSDASTFGAQLGLYGQYINFLSGDDYTQFDFTGGFNISEKLFLGINATTTELAADASFSGVALYPQYTISDSFSLGLRGEIFSETNGGAGALYSGALSGSSENADNTSFTITGSYTKGNFILKPEFRIDTASANIYSKNATDFSDNLASFVVAAIYAF